MSQYLKIWKILPAKWWLINVNFEDLLFVGYSYKVPTSIKLHFMTAIEKFCCVVFQKQALTGTLKTSYSEN